MDRRPANQPAWNGPEDGYVLADILFQKPVAGLFVTGPHDAIRTLGHLTMALGIALMIILIAVAALPLVMAKSPA